MARKSSPVEIEKGIKSDRQSTESATSTGVDQKNKKPPPPVPVLFPPKKATSIGASPGHDPLPFKLAAADGHMTQESTIGAECCTLLSEESLKQSTILPEEKKKPGHDQGMAVATFMCPEMYRAVTSGDKTYFEKLIEGQQIPWDQESPRGSTILHIAASLRHDDLAKLIQKSRHELVTRTNRTGDIPLHVAASAGHLSTVKILLTDPTECSEEQPLRMKNHEEDTPLHVALKNRYEKVASVLFDADPEVSYYLNKEGKSPLYLATEAGLVKLVKLMMEKSPKTKSDISVEAKSMVHAAITSKNKDVLETILASNQGNALLKANNYEGLTPLSYAAFIGHLHGVRYILQKFTNYAYISNENGTFPIHVASSKGYIKIIEEFLKYCPDSGEMLTNQDDWNILHIAARNGKARAVRHILKMPNLEMLINERDMNGNTPLHLASKGGHPKVVSILTWDKRVKLNLLNYEDKPKTALDIALNYSGKMPSFRERLTWQALKHAGASRAQRPSIVGVKLQSSNQPEEPRSKTQSSETAKPLSKPQSSNQPEDPRSKIQSSEKGEPPHEFNYKDRVNTLLLVATLVTTVTFAASFTMPGGYSSSERHQGMANFVKRRMFHAFVISNTIAMYSSITAVVALIWAQLGDLNLAIASVEFSVPLLGIALTMVSVAFMTGIYLVVSSLNWLATTVLIMGSIFLFILLVIFVPLYSPRSLHHTIPRYIFYYPFRLLIIVTQSDSDNEKESL